MQEFLATYACDVHLLVGIVTTNSVFLCDRGIKKGHRNKHSIHGPQKTIPGIYIYPLTSWQTFVTSQNPQFKYGTAL